MQTLIMIEFKDMEHFFMVQPLELKWQIPWVEGMALSQLLYYSFSQPSFLGDGEQGTTEGEILKRGYAFSHFSKFVRPGYQRIKVGLASEPGVLVSAYKGENQVVIQLINTTAEAKSNINFMLKRTRPAAATSYTTGLLLSRQKKAVDLDPSGSGSVLTLSIQAASITTVVLEL